MLTLEEIFPPFGLRITCGDLELRALREADLPELVELQLGGVVAEGEVQPFIVPWNLAPADALPSNTARFLWSKWGAFSPKQWTLLLGVRRAGVLVGQQDLMTTTDFRHTRSAESGSWLGTAYQRQGIGTLMRQMVAVFAFDHLGAEELRSAAIRGNAGSAGVSRKVGYATDGTERMASEEGYAVHDRFLLTPSALVRPAAPVAVEGAEAFRRFVGLE